MLFARLLAVPLPDLFRGNSSDGVADSGAPGGNPAARISRPSVGAMDAFGSREHRKNFARPSGSLARVNDSECCRMPNAECRTF